MQRRSIAFILIVLALVALSVVVNLRTEPRLGLDIAGGIRFRIRAEIDKLSPEERAREGLFIADAIMRGVPFSEDFREVPEWVMKHHENLDGSGYPHGLRADQIPLGSRILAIVNAFDKATSGRAESDAPMSESDALEWLESEAGARFDEELVQVFIGKQCYKKVEKRRWARYDYTTPVDVTMVQPDGTEGESIETDALDISEGGILFKSEEPIAPFTLLKLLIHLPTEKVEGMARVARVLEGEGGAYKIGAYFLWLGGME